MTSADRTDGDLTELWRESRSGSHAGRGFRYQDAVASELALLALDGQLDLREIVPEGIDDISVEVETGWIHLQTKSRREHRGAFQLSTLVDVWSGLAARLVADPASRVALIIEQPLDGVDSGFDLPLATVASPRLRAAIDAGLVGTGVTLEDFLSRSHVVVMAASSQSAVEILGRLTGAPPATCVAYREILRAQMGRLADENGDPDRSANEAASMTRTDLAKLFEDVATAIDPSALEEAVVRGACEVADFTTTREDGRFFAGVDVTLGHVVAGLPMDRPAEIEALARGLEERGVALAVGPAGAGKSALIWMTAFALRHAATWYRIKRLTADDVAAIVRLAKGAVPHASAPIGFVVDDLGSGASSGFDELVKEFREHPDCVVLGACREEDLATIRSSTSAAQVRPELSEALAKRLWLELRETEATRWQDWREPFEASRGLLLEYGYLLTEGERLDETIAGQISDRILESRDAELDILAPTALVNAFGASIEVDALPEITGRAPGEVRAALVRLRDEHLVVEEDGYLVGLHALRSIAITRAIHAAPPPTLGATVHQVIQSLPANQMREFLCRLLLSDLVGEGAVRDGLIERFTTATDIETLAGALHALRVGAVHTETRRWRAILEETGVPPTDIAVVIHYATTGERLDEDLLPERLRKAIERIRSLPGSDARTAVLAHVGGRVNEVLSAADDCAQAVEILAALPESEDQLEIDPQALTPLASRASLHELRELMEAAYAVSPALAISIAELLGGEPSLMRRLQDELPWVRQVRTGTDKRGRAIARAEYAYVADQADPHGKVVEVTHYLHALSPSAEIAKCVALDASGQPAGFGDHRIADKAIPRANNPSTIAVAWNRTRARAAYAAVAAGSLTEYATDARALIRRLTPLLFAAGDAFARGTQMEPGTIEQLVDLEAAAGRLRPSPRPFEPLGATDAGELDLLEPTSAVISMTVSNLIVRMFDPTERGVALAIPNILERVGDLENEDVWRALSVSPVPAVRKLKELLADLHAVVAEVETGPNEAESVRTSAPQGFKIAASLARNRADSRLMKLAEAVQEAAPGTAVHRIAGGLKDPWWPPDPFVVLAELDSMLAWNPHALAARCRPLLKGRPAFVVAPVRNGQVVASCAYTAYAETLVPAGADSIREVPTPMLIESLADQVRDAIAGATIASGILGSLASPDAHEQELDLLEHNVDRIDRAANHVLTHARQLEGAALAELEDFVLHLQADVADEARALGARDSVSGRFARSVLQGATGSPDEMYRALESAVLVAIECDVDLDAANVLVREV